MQSPARRSIRWKGYDYSQPGLYYLTICTYRRRCTLGAIESGRVRLTRLGEIARECWMQIPYHFARVDLDVFVIMPNHLHGILVLHKDWRSPARPRAQHAAPLQPLVAPRSLAAIVRSFKAAVTKKAAEQKMGRLQSVWQRNYYEHIVRGGKDLAAIRGYIADNPSKGALDEENPEFEPQESSHFERS